MFILEELLYKHMSILLCHNLELLKYLKKNKIKGLFLTCLSATIADMKECFTHISETINKILFYSLIVSSPFSAG